MIEYLKICRIDHWLKNIFIVFGHAVAVVLFYQLDFNSEQFAEVFPGGVGQLVVRAIVSLIPVCLIASAYYILNEILDAPFDAKHPRKKLRGIPAGKVKVPVLWAIMAVLLVVGFVLAWFLIPNKRYFVALVVLMFCACLYNIPPIRLKDKAFLDVITESFNNPLRLWLGWYAVLPASFSFGAPISIVFAWWSFGALLMTGKRYTEYRFIGDDQARGEYRKSFNVYTERRLIIAMIVYCCIFCFCTGVAMTTYPPITNLVLIFPMIIVALMFYFRTAMREASARLEPEELMKNPWIILSTVVTGIGAVWLLFAHQNGSFQIKRDTPFLRATWEMQTDQPGGSEEGGDGE